MTQRREKQHLHFHRAKLNWTWKAKWRELDYLKQLHSSGKLLLLLHLFCVCFEIPLTKIALTLKSFITVDRYAYASTDHELLFAKILVLSRYFNCYVLILETVECKTSCHRSIWVWQVGGGGEKQKWWMSKKRNKGMKTKTMNKWFLKKRINQKREKIKLMCNQLYQQCIGDLSHPFSGWDSSFSLHLIHCTWTTNMSHSVGTFKSPMFC